VLAVDTEALFALNPKDSKHRYALKLFKEDANIVAPDTAILEFQSVLRARGRPPSQVKMALLSLHELLIQSKVKEEKTITASLLALQCELEENYGLSYFNSLVAASALTMGRRLVSDDEAFDRIPNIERIPLSQPPTA